MRWTREKQKQQIRHQRREDSAGFGEAAALVKAAYEPPGKRQQLSKAELRAMAEAAAASLAQRGVAITRCPAQQALPADLQLKPKQPKLR